MTTATQDKTVLIMILEEIVPFTDMYGSLIDALSSKAKLINTKTAQDAIQHLSDATKVASLFGVLVVDGGIVHKKYKTVATRLLEYVKNGGMVIFGFGYPSFTRPSDSNTFFANQMGLPWKFGAYHRETFVLSSVVARFMQPKYRAGVKDYSMKAVQMKDVPVDARVYVSTEEENQTAAACQKVGKGYFGWIGDVNTEEGSTWLVLMMCDL
ncbi:hypothetical protein FRB94_014307 [Tulasnella sp. JGI-2019a]|nr:hypothetical protein FRB94_014307 [Tulasnella sp. JGI-2019a]KAG8999636.1 hypothetical protein FRB93_013155 [Tulasnella sp. JGI-2019a]KAG9034739.1 hypothetical protein FRB95_012689 [Tulasnella sp. JGI-2019a]